ncbi:MAG TPA: DUF1343 domain-containing protein [bacterium]|nr:DUF1343 domain-containing protein [bacterium]
MASSPVRMRPLALASWVLLLLLTALPARSEQQLLQVRPGLEVLLRDHLPELKGRRVGLVCNHTAIDSHGNHAIDLLRDSGVQLVALFSPEHGIRGRVVAGKIADSTDPISGLPIYSLYGDTRKPTPQMLNGIDLLLFDLQDIGARFYTYSSTLALVMQAAGEQGIPVWVLDRPNPTGGAMTQGPLLDPACASFLGYYPIPVRHGMTLGELALLFRGEYQVACEVQVIHAEGWRRVDLWEATGLPWVPPSPSIWHPSATLTYPAMCFFEGTNCSIGGSTYKPYEVVAAPWIEPEPLCAELNRRGYPGVRFECIEYVPAKPNDGKYQGELCKGIHLQVTDPATFDPVLCGAALLQAIGRQYPEKISYRRPHMRLLAGSGTFLDEVLKAKDLTVLKSRWDRDCATFNKLRQPYLLYR